MRRLSCALILAALAVVVLPSSAGAVTCRGALKKSGNFCVPKGLTGAQGTVQSGAGSSIVTVALGRNAKLNATCTYQGVAQQRQLDSRSLRISGWGLLSGKNFRGVSFRGTNYIFTSGRYLSSTKAEFTIRGVAIVGNRTPDDPLGTQCAIPPQKFTVTGTPQNIGGTRTPAPFGATRTCKTPFTPIGTLCTGMTLIGADGFIMTQGVFNRTGLVLWNPLPLVCAGGNGAQVVTQLLERGRANKNISGNNGNAARGFQVTINGSYVTKTSAQAQIDVNGTTPTLGQCRGSVLLKGGPVSVPNNTFFER